MRLPRFLTTAAALLTAFLTAGSVPVPAAEGEVATAEAAPRLFVAGGKSVAATFHAIDEGGKVVFDLDGRRQAIAAENVVSWGEFSEPGRGPRVVTVGGGVISLATSAEIRIADDHLVTHSESLGKVRLPMAMVMGILFHPPADVQHADRLTDELRAAAGTSDWVILEGGDKLSGTLLSLADDKIRLETNVRPLEVPTAKITAAAFNPSLVEKPRDTGRRTIFGLSDGSRLPVTSATAAEDGTLRLKVVGGLAARIKVREKVRGSQTQTRQVVTALLPLGGRVTYLSDLTPAAYRHVPYLKLPWPYHADRNVLGTHLRAGDRLHLKGLGVHSASRLTYRLDGSSRRFAAQVAVDDAARRRGSVTFRVYLYDGSAWKSAYASGVVRGGDAPLDVSVDLTGAKAISLLVDFADRGDELDYADWIGARLEK